MAGFYRDRFFTGGVLEAAFFDSINRFDIQYARTMWVYDNVRRGSSVLDLGCGEGMLALLKRKGVTLVGLDLSPELLAAASRNGYDGAYLATLTALPGIGHLHTPARWHDFFTAAAAAHTTAPPAHQSG